MKDNATIINELVANAAVVLENKAEYLDLVAEQYEADGDSRGVYWRQKAARARLGAEIIREQAGCWA